MVLPFKGSRLSVALTPLSALVLFVTGNTLLYGIIHLEVSSVMMHSLGKKIYQRVLIGRILSVRTICNVDSFN